MLDLLAILIAAERTDDLARSALPATRTARSHRGARVRRRTHAFPAPLDR